MVAMLAGCYGTGYVGVRHDRYYHHYPYQSSSYSGYPYHSTRYYGSGPYYRPYSHGYYSGSAPSLNLSYTRTTYRSPAYSYRAPNYSYGAAPRYTATSYVASSPRYSASAVRVNGTRVAAPAGGPSKVHAKHQDQGKHKGRNRQ
jgi:hypothetical protein